MHKMLLLLGLLLNRPLHGYELHRIVRAHGELYADLKKANLYYLLERLAAAGDLSVETEAGTRGARGERVIYTLTEQGRQHFYQYLQEILLDYEPVHTGVGTAVVFLSNLPHSEGIELLEKRRGIVLARQEAVVAELGDLTASSPLVRIAGDHLLTLIQAELDWITRSLAYLQNIGWSQISEPQLQHRKEESTPSNDLPTADIPSSSMT